MSALRAFLSFDSSYKRLSQQLADEAQLAGYGALVCSALDIAVRRRLGSAPAPGDVVKLAASLRISLHKQQIELEPLTMEDIIRSAADNAMTGRHDDRIRAETLLFVLGQLVFDEDLDDAELDDFLLMARAMAARRRRRRFGQEASTGGNTST
jgi:hypothetical protein